MTRTAAGYERARWRAFARAGAVHAPLWFVRAAPPVLGVAFALALPSARANVRAMLTRVRGPRGRARDAVDAAKTFASFAASFAEGLAVTGRHGARLRCEVRGRGALREALARGRGAVVVTAHTSGWEIAGPRLGGDAGVDVTVVAAAEPDAAAGAMQNSARERGGVRVVHAAGDLGASLSLLHTLARGGVVAFQLDRVPEGMRGVSVSLFGGAAEVPLGPFVLARAARAPVVVAFARRTGFLAYEVVVVDAFDVPRDRERAARAHERDADVAAFAQRAASAMERFVAAHPTEWHAFSPPGGPPRAHEREGEAAGPGRARGAGH